MLDESRAVAPEDILITEHLYRRNARPDDLQAEVAAYRELSTMMTRDPVAAIDRFLELAIELCPAAGTAGLSELVEDPQGTPYFAWTALSGALAEYVGGTTPRDFSPCGLCLDSHHTVLVETPARVFPYFNDAQPAIVEGLIVPLYDTGKKPLGTLWVTSHERHARFDATDARVMEQLAVQLVLAIKLRRKAKLMLELEQASHDKEMLVIEVRHRVKNMIQMTSSLLQLQEGALRSDEARAALREAQSRLLVMASVYEALIHPDSDGRLVNVGALVEMLTAALSESGPHSDTVRITTDCEAILLDVDSAVPLGLIVNEAVTNALKHAFPDDQAGEIFVDLRKSSKSIRLVIRDNGRGFAAARREGSLGMRLMTSLARQLRASLTVDGSDGGRIELAWTSPLAEEITEKQSLMLQ